MAQAQADEVHAIIRDRNSERDSSGQDLEVLCKGNVAAHHVVEKNAKGPYGGGPSEVLVVLDPLRWGIHFSTCNKRKSDGQY